MYKHIIYYDIIYYNSPLTAKDWLKLSSSRGAEPRQALQHQTVSALRRNPRAREPKIVRASWRAAHDIIYYNII